MSCVQSWCRWYSSTSIVYNARYIESASKYLDFKFSPAYIVGCNLVKFVMVYCIFFTICCLSTISSASQTGGVILFRTNAWFAVIFLFVLNFFLFLYTVLYARIAGHPPCNALRPWLWKAGSFFGAAWTCLALIIGLAGKTASNQDGNQKAAFIVWLVGIGVDVIVLMSVFPLRL